MFKRSAIAMALIPLVVILLGTLAALIVPHVFGPTHDEVARVRSPNGTIDAVLVETNGGATTSFGYLVYVAKHDSKPAGTPVVRLYAAARNESAYGANLKWESSTLLAVEFLSARNKEIAAPSISIEGQSVEVVLREGVRDGSAPSGGMLYNLSRRD